MTDRNDLEQWQETNKVRVAEFWELMKAELAKDPPVELEGTVIDAIPLEAAASKELAPMTTQEVVVREIPREPENAAEAVLIANFREELEDMWLTRREDPDAFYATVGDSQDQLERLIRKHNAKTGYVEPTPQPALPTRQQRRDEAMVETRQSQRFEELFRP